MQLSYRNSGLYFEPFFEKYYGSSSPVVCEIRKMLDIQKSA